MVALLFCPPMDRSLEQDSTKILDRGDSAGRNRHLEVRRSVWVPWDWLLRLPHDFRLPGFRVRRDLPDFRDWNYFPDHHDLPCRRRD